MTKVLIVEDEALIAMLLEEMLIDRGFTVVAHAATLAEAEVSAAELDIDVAILDVSLGDEQVYPVAETLAARNIPFLFTTGYGAVGMPAAWSGRPVFTKPYDIAELATTLSQLLEPVS